MDGGKQSEFPASTSHISPVIKHDIILYSTIGNNMRACPAEVIGILWSILDYILDYTSLLICLCIYVQRSIHLSGVYGIGRVLDQKVDCSRKEALCSAFKNYYTTDLLCINKLTDLSFAIFWHGPGNQNSGKTRYRIGYRVVIFIYLLFKQGRIYYFAPMCQTLPNTLTVPCKFPTTLVFSCMVFEIVSLDVIKYTRYYSLAI